MENIVHTPDLPCLLQLACIVSNLIWDLKWSKKILLQFGGARESQAFVRQHNPVPKLGLYNPIVLV